MRALLILIELFILALVWGRGGKISPVEEISDPKAFKQLLRTRTNVLVLFYRRPGVSSALLKAFKDAAEEVRGIGTMISVDCAGQGQKLCRQMKASPELHVIHHYKDGKFHKVYDRLETTKSIVRFMNDPSGDRPWEEEPSGKSVVHLDGLSTLAKLLKKNRKAMVMFYAPWCVYCKQMKPEYAAAAEKVKSEGLGVLAAVDVVRPENAGMRTKYNITGFPTVHYFKNGEIIATYEGDNKQDKIVEFMKDPLAVLVKEKDTIWSDEKTDVHHLTTDNFDQFLKDQQSALVMFYAPWCGHCKTLKPEWVKAASAQVKQKISTVVAAVDVTKETKLGEQFKVKGFPTIKYFKDGEFSFDTPNLRDASKIIEFLKNPKEPPPAPPPEPNWADMPSEVVHLTDDNFKSQLRSKRHALVMFYAPWCGHCKAAKPEFETAADELKDEPRLVLAAVNCMDHAAICKTYDVRGYPTFKYFKYFKDATNYDGGRLAADFINFLRSLEPDSAIKSENIEATTVPPQPSVVAEEIKIADSKKDQDDTPSYPGWDRLLHLTDDNYKALFSQHKQLFIMFHTKWCTNCTITKPIYAELALKKDLKLATLAACDAEQANNLVDELMVNAVPWFTFVRNGKAVENYVGDRSASAIEEFLLKMNTNKKDEL